MQTKGYKSLEEQRDDVSVAAQVTYLSSGAGL